MALAVASAQTAPAQSRPPDRFGFGEPAPRPVVEALDTDVRPDGKGLPPGAGTAKEGATVYATQCAACHGARGEGGSADVLVASEPRGMLPFGPQYEQWRGSRPDVPFTIGNYWPYATTLFDYIRRAMPLSAPGTLSPNDVYAVVAWLLAQNGIIAEADVMNAETLPRVMMPAHGRFVPDNRRGRPEVR
jgi:cytochrome c